MAGRSGRRKPDIKTRVGRSGWTIGTDESLDMKNHEGRTMRTKKDDQDDQARTIRTDEGSDIGSTQVGQSGRTKRTIKTGSKFVAVRLDMLTRTAAPDSRLVTAIAEKRNPRAKPCAGEPRG